MSFLSQSEMIAAFVALTQYLNPVSHIAAGAIADVDGVVVVLADTSGGAFALTLPVSPSKRFAPIIVNIGPNILTITGTVNAVVNPTISIQWSALELKHSSGTYYTGIRVIP